MDDTAPRAPTQTPSAAASKVMTKLLERFRESLDQLEVAEGFARGIPQNEAFQQAEQVLQRPGGVEALSASAHRFDEVGLFAGGPWEDATKLRPPLVAGSLKAQGIYPVLELLSELRVLAIAQGRCQGPLSAEDAQDFLEQVMALNLDLLFPSDTEESRISPPPFLQPSRDLFALLARELGLGRLRAEVVEEIEQICAQRPIMTRRVVEMIEVAERIPEDADDSDPEARDRLAVFVSAVRRPSPLSASEEDPVQYREALQRASREQLEDESRALAQGLRATGLANPDHAVLLRFLRRHHPDLIGQALGLNAVGLASLDQNQTFAHQLIKVAVLPSTASAIYGFARMLERGLLSRTEVKGGLRRLVDLDLRGEVRKALLAHRPVRDGVTANSVLVAGAISVLGQPLGIGQGRNPTCQAARGISLWSQHAPGYLLGLVATAARDGTVEMAFEGDLLNSRELVQGLITDFDLELDPVSIVAVPHLDRIYNEMMRRVALRDQDGHRWVNPALYGRWVGKGFASALDKTGYIVVDYDEFVRRFYATHHPAYNDGYELVYPNPVGIVTTSSHGELLGLHAISLTRVRHDVDGELRCYFFNPNNEGRQDWGQGIRPAVSGHGEREGESSLLFHHFTARLYAFHYNPYEEGDAFAVPDDVIREITALSKASWGRALTWR